MVMMKGKKILITSGGCLEKWDQVRGHTNLAKGTIGRILAEEAMAKGAHVIYLHGYFAEKPSTYGTQLELHPFEGIIDLQDKMKSIITHEKIDAVIMAAAGSDWIVDKISDQDGNVLDKNGKISSDIAPIIHFQKAPKVLKQIKEWDPEIVLVGFKLESDISEEELIHRAKERMGSAKADIMIANSSHSLYSHAAIHHVIGRDGEVQLCEGKDETAKVIVSGLEHLCNTKTICF
ncbi:phosphopantothenoylcysteine decarboxylase [Bacillus sp. DX1.1]|uniref:phosphopantothenoylcysteine decarboxylase domain-containing protein n=1 Tax=unclassified Bacillus (in: firmicutes) TaxID=185979 RepID=UPI00256FCF90|nr:MULTISPECIES: phosphopantothenoylcysteine decarboxylase [unclassified Bacillus (in: firmicutes)]MDM5155267.1 phosphopantothenoylcysteine decarboxylase [Bacillus sp. DX1.1]WJE79587.1 phosphopantothenoylcysteine decarboxylase [Bacillus sp. DX3.1]